MAERRRLRLPLYALAALSGVVVFLIATDLFPHHSLNHDEGVYLQQAEMLLDGQLRLYPDLPDAVRPWFFVQDGDTLYPKYAPVPAGVFALGVAVGVPRLALAAVAAANVVLAGLVTAEAFDERTGLLAAGLFAASPLFLINSAVFLPYAPTTAFNLLFALAYLRACRADCPRARRRYAALAGVAVGVAFFSRPFTAVLFAAPFVLHALAVLASARTTAPADATTWLGVDRRPIERYGLVAGLGLAGVGVTLAYNLAVTGDPLVFPYEAFAPLDGPGFGTRRMLNYEREYTPALALRANGLVLWTFLTRWTVAAPLGSIAAGIGLAVATARGLRDRPGTPAPSGLSDHGARALLAGLFVSVPVGNVFFWGNLNILASLDVPDDGLIAPLGPFYHFDLLLPLAAFGAVGVLAAVRYFRAVLAERAPERVARGTLVVTFAVLLVVAGVAQATALGEPMDRNRPYTDRYERAYEPIEDRAFDNALVFVPTPYGEWLNHPFQSLRNDPGFDGPVLYALDREPRADFRVLDTYPDRRPYRYTYRGRWEPDAETEAGPVEAAIRPLSVEGGDSHRLTTAVGTVTGAETATVRLAGPNGSVHYGIERLPAGEATVRWIVGDGRARLNESGLVRYSDDSVVRFDEVTELSLTVTFTQSGGSTVSYRQEVAVDPTGEGVRVIWPPEASVCRLVTDCGRAGTYLPDADGYSGGVSLTQEIETRNGTDPA